MKQTPVGVILAAGRGTRMHPLSCHIPKPLLPIADEPLIAHQFRLLKACGIERVLVVVGHLAEAFPQQLGRGDAWGVTIEYVTQSRAEGIADALLQCEPFVDGPMVVLLGDIFFVTDPLSAAVEEVVSGRAAANLLSKQVRDRREICKNFEIIADSNRRVVEVLEKPQQPRTDMKGCGLYVFTPEIFDAIRRTPRSALRNEYELTDAIQTMIRDGATVIHSPTIVDDVNVTTPADLLQLNQRALIMSGKPSLVSTNVEVPIGSSIVHSVVCSGVIMRQPVVLIDCLVLPGVIIDEKLACRSSVIGPAGVVACPELVMTPAA